MAGLLRPRGPDDEGFYEHGKIHLGHRRLSIIDLEGSRQPLFNEDRSKVLVYNGEIYNFPTLRQKLLASGHRFTTQGDSEVLVHAYEEYGVGMLSQLSGMFAFALWDETRRSLFLARDHLGVKPLYYYWDGQTFAFASELKALLQHPGVRREVDLEAVGLYLQCQYIPSPLTIYQKIKKLPAGHGLLFKDQQIEIFRYWQPDYRNKLAVTEDEAVDLLDQELRRSVQSMLIADVPLGAFISGGIDSGLVAALMTDCLGKPLETFNLGFLNTRGGKSEHQEALRVARHLGSHHHSFMIDAKDMLDNIGELVECFDEPFADTAALPTLMLSKLTSPYVKVVLTGEGADEVFAGYGNYQQRLSDESILAYFTGRFSPFPFIFSSLPGILKKERLLHALTKPRSHRHVTIPQIFHEARLKNIFSPTFFSSLHMQLSEFAAKFFDECNSSDYLDKIMYVDLRLWLPDDLLTKVDRATMAYSLEARVPYLDHRLIEFCAGLPSGLKQHQRTTKFILKKVAQRYLPPDIVHRSKQGFVMPVKEWLQFDLKDYLLDKVSTKNLLKRNLFQPQKINQLISEHMTGKKNRSFRLWTLLILELWLEKYEPSFEL